MKPKALYNRVGVSPSEDIPLLTTSHHRSASEVLQIKRPKSAFDNFHKKNFSNPDSEQRARSASYSVHRMNNFDINNYQNHSFRLNENAKMFSDQLPNMVNSSHKS